MNPLNKHLQTLGKTFWMSGTSRGCASSSSDRVLPRGPQVLLAKPRYSLFRDAANLLASLMGAMASVLNKSASSLAAAAAVHSTKDPFRVLDGMLMHLTPS